MIKCGNLGLGVRGVLILDGRAEDVGVESRVGFGARVALGELDG